MKTRYSAWKQNSIQSQRDSDRDAKRRRTEGSEEEGYIGRTKIKKLDSEFEFPAKNLQETMKENEELKNQIKEEKEHHKHLEQMYQELQDLLLQTRNKSDSHAEIRMLRQEIWNLNSQMQKISEEKQILLKENETIQQLSRKKIEELQGEINALKRISKNNFATPNPYGFYPNQKNQNSTGAARMMRVKSKQNEFKN